MVGKQFNRITVLKRDYGSHGKGIYWECLCKCGNTKIIRGDHLRSGKIQSCGCLRKTVRITHGMTTTGTYEVWEHMKQRCNNPKDRRYKNYGGRGINVCEEWRKFENFYADMGERPGGLTIERIDNELGYFKDNCCWDTPIAQSRNQSIKITNKTGVRGVHFNKKYKKYCVQIAVNYKTHHIGFYNTLEKATIARKKAEELYWGRT